MIQTGSDLSSFGALLKNFRKRRHLTQHQLAEIIGVHRSTLIHWEQGDCLPESKAMVLELGRHLHLDDQETRHLLEASLTALTPRWWIPLPRNPFFTGREEMLEKLHTRLGAGQPIALTQSSALHGLGGVGKTQIALEYAYCYALEYSAVFWIEAEKDEQIVASMLHIAEILQLSQRDEKDQQRVIAAVQHWLSSHGQWLLIWDNVEDLDVLHRFLPSARSGSLLITTRCQVLGTLAQGLDLLPMEHGEGILFLLRRAKMVELEASDEQMRQYAESMPAQYAVASELVTALGGLPLALDQAGAYLEETCCGLPAYLELFRARRDALLQQRGKGVQDHPASVSGTFTLAITAAAERHPAVKELLQVCALLQPDAIPEEIVRLGGKHLGPTLEAVCRDALEWDRVVGVACSYSLLARQSEKHTLSIHRLVQAVLLDTMTEAERVQWSRRAISALDTAFPEVLPVTEYAIWMQCERLLPHALLCLHRDGVGKQSLILASLAYKVAQYLRVRGQYARAETLHQHALSIQEHMLETNHPEVVSSLYSLALLYCEQGQYTRAEPLFQRALSIGEQVLGPDHPEVACVLNGLGMVYRAQDKYVQAESFYQRALSIRERVLGPDHPEVAISLNRLAELFFQQGKYTQSEVLHQRALSIRERVLGPDHPEVAISLNNLAELFLQQSKYAQAEPLFQRALSIREQALGPDHPYVATPLKNLAILLQEQGDYAKAEPLYQRALSITEKNLGSDHPYVAIMLNNLANLYQDQTRYKEAEPLYQRALWISEQGLGPEDPDVATSLNNLANLYCDQGKYEQAEPLYQRAFAIREQHLGQHHLETAQTLHDLATFRQKQGKQGEAVAQAERALSIRTQGLGEAHPKTITTRTLYTKLLHEQADMIATTASAHNTAAASHSGEASDEVGSTSSQLPVSDDLISCGHDPLQAFLDACCERHPRAWCRSADLWRAYERWTEIHQERYPLSRGAFIAQLKVHGCRADRTKTNRIWRGIALLRTCDDGE